MYTFCPGCGAILTDDGSTPIIRCPACGTTVRSRLHQDIPTMEERSVALGDAVRHWFLLIAISWFVMMLMYIFLNHLLGLLGAIVMLPPHLLESSYTLALYIPVAVPLITISGSFLLIYFLCIALILLWAVNKTMGSPGDLLRDLRGFARGNKPSGVLYVLQVFILVYTFALLYHSVISLWTTPKGPGDWNMSSWQFLFLLANASVYEEIVTRALLIGLPLLIIDRMRGKDTPLTFSFLGGGRDMRIPEISLLLISTIIFSSAHVFNGWDIYKVPDTMITGLALGYLFLRKGIHTSIFLHFTINYMGIVSFLPFPAEYVLTCNIIMLILLLSAIPLCIFYMTLKILKVV